MANDVTLLIKLRDQVSGQVRKITAASNKAEVAVKKLERAVKRTGIQLERMRRKGVSSLKTIADKAKNAAKSFRGFGKAAALAAAAAGAAAFAKFAFGAAGELEKQTRSLEVLTGSLETAKEIISELQAFGAVTPFTSQELIETSKRLKAFGFETEQVVDVTKRLADVAGATGADLGGIATAFGQIQAKGRLQTEELLQLQERGVGLGDELQKMYGMTGEEFSKALEKGQISAEAANVALIRLTEQGGKYANGAVAQSDTLFGKLSTLQDAFQRFGQNIGKFLSPIFKGIIDFLTTITNQINNLFGEMARNAAIDKQARKDLGLPEAGGGRLTGQERAKLRVRKKTLREQGFGMDKLSTPKTPDMTIPELRQVAGGTSGKTGKTPEEKAAEEAAKIAQASADRVRSLEQQTLLASALTDEERTQFERQIQIAEILENKKGLSQEQINAELQATTALFEQQDATKQILETNKELTAEQQRQTEFAERIGQTIQSGLVQGIQDAITGSKSLGESLSGILKQLGGMFLNAGIGGLGKSLGIPGFGMAEGGYVSGPTPALVGEGGEPEYVIPSSKMNEAMGRYARGARGGAVIPDGPGGDASGGMTGGGGSIDVSYSVERINNVNYVTAAEFERGMAQAAKRGAELGRQGVYSDLVNKRSVRSRVGV